VGREGKEKDGKRRGGRDREGQYALSVGTYFSGDWYVVAGGAGFRIRERGGGLRKASFILDTNVTKSKSCNLLGHD